MSWFSIQDIGGVMRKLQKGNSTRLAFLHCKISTWVYKLIRVHLFVGRVTIKKVAMSIDN